MILIDTSVWVNHFRTRDAVLTNLLEEGLAGTHPFVIVELASGNLRDRAKTLDYFRALPQSPVASEQEVHRFLEAHRLWGLGLGWVDLHLLAAASLAGWRILTADRVMKVESVRLKLT